MDYLSGSGRRSVLPRGSTLGLRALLLSLISLGMMYADSRTDYLAQARIYAGMALYPLQRAIAFPQDVAALFEHFHSREALLAENRQLREERLEMSARLSRQEALEADTNRMRELLAAATALARKVRIAEILSIAQDPYRQQIVINKGSDDGVYRGQALVDAYGVMGQIIQVNPANSVALLVTDANHGIPVEINRTGLQTIALGRGDAQSLSLPFLPSNADIKVGDLIVSSALGGRFPAGYPVGKIYEVHHQPGEHFAEAIANPAAKLNQGRQALLIWGENPDQTVPPLVQPAPAAPTAKPAPAAADKTPDKKPKPTTPAKPAAKPSAKPPAKPAPKPATGPPAELPGEPRDDPQSATPASPANPPAAQPAAPPAAPPAEPPTQPPVDQ
jgi:rod shape-determining protein MreC